MVETNNLKKRHGCVTIFILVGIVSTLCMLGTTILGQLDLAHDAIEQIGHYAQNNIHSIFILKQIWYVITVGFGILNLVSLIMLLRCNRFGFNLMYIGMAIVLLICFVLSISINYLLGIKDSILIWQSFITFFIFILAYTISYCVFNFILRHKWGGVSAWAYMTNKGFDYKHFRHIYQLFGFIMIFCTTVCGIKCCTYKGDDNAPKIDDTEKIIADSIMSSEIMHDKEIAPSKISSKENTMKKKEKKDSISHSQPTIKTKREEVDNWVTYTSGRFSVTAPPGYKDLDTGNTYIKMCKIKGDDDPSFRIMSEPVGPCEQNGIETLDQYVSVVTNVNKKTTPSMAIISRSNYKSAIVQEYSVVTEGNKFYFKTRYVRKNGCYNQYTVMCLYNYRSTLSDDMNRILKSMK